MRALCGARALAILGALSLSCAAFGGFTQAKAARAATAAAPPASAASERLSHGRFQNLAIYRPPETPARLVLLVSGDRGLSAGVANLAQQLARHGALVAAIDYPKLAANLEADDADCIFPDGDFENLSHFLQAYYHLPNYLPPFLVGYGAGAALTYATLVQAPSGTFAGAVTLGFCPTTKFRKPLCKGSGIEFTRVPADSGMRFSPVQSLNSSWVLLQGERGGACSASAVAEFTAHIRGAAGVTVPQLQLQLHDAAAAASWMPQFLAAFDTLVARSASRLTPPAPIALGDLPIVEVPAQPAAQPTDTFAVILSGDGGWAGLDKEVADALSVHGTPVVGLDSLRYFWSARTSQGLAADIDRMIRYYLRKLGKKRVLLIGYSQGADVLPFAVNRLSGSTRPAIARVVLMGMSEHALFEFHVSSWISDDNSGPATLPEVNRITGLPVVCIYGEDDSDSLCPKLDPTKVRVVKLKGGHHFDGDYANLARQILAAAAR
jgi:type IV secretory pathway VirJ component